MKNSIEFKNILTLLRFFYLDSFHGLFNRPFFRKRINKYALIILFLFLYFIYFYYNMIEVAHLAQGTQDASSKSILMASKVTLSSYTNLTFVISIIFFVFINSTISLSKNSLYFAKILPFSLREVEVSLNIFRLSVSLFFFELIMIVVLPALKLIPMTLFMSFLFLITLHLIFIDGFLLVSWIYHFIIQLFSKNRSLVSFALDLILSMISIIYSTSLRYIVDYTVGQSSFSISNIILSIFSLSMLLLIVNYFLIKNSIKADASYARTNFIFLFPLNNDGLNLSFPPVIRHKEFIYFLGFTILTLGILVIQNGLNNAMQSLAFLFPMIGISGICYSEGTIKFKKLFNILRLTPFNEFSSILFVSSTLMVPSLLIGILVIHSLDPYVFGICIFVSSITAGLLFPKSESNINETVSFFITFVVIVLLAISINVKGSLLLALFILLVILYCLLKIESKETKL